MVSITLPPGGVAAGDVGAGAGAGGLLPLGFVGLETYNIP